MIVQLTCLVAALPAFACFLSMGRPVPFQPFPPQSMIYECRDISFVHAYAFISIGQEKEIPLITVLKLQNKQEKSQEKK